ncbi:MAG: class I SAM-dependent methyltransferase [Pseudomonadota bacterium]
MKTQVELGPVQETLLIPLLGRAVETAKPDGILKDTRAVEIVEELDYDFDKWRGGPSLLGACIRTLMYDRFVETFLQKHPFGTVVEIGCGLNTRFDRTDNGTVRWFDLDLPDTIALRRRYFDETPRYQMLAGSILDDSWVQPVQDTPGPWLFLSEAVLIYLDESDVKRAVEQLVASFPNVTLVVDTANAAMVDSQGSHDAMQHLPQESWFRWKCERPEIVEQWASGLKLEQSLTFADIDKQTASKLPLKWRLPLRLAPWFFRRRVDGYRLNLFTDHRAG